MAEESVMELSELIKVRVPYDDRKLPLCDVAHSAKLYLDDAIDLAPALYFLKVALMDMKSSPDEYETKGLIILLESLVDKIGEIQVSSSKIRDTLKTLSGGRDAGVVF